MSWRQYLAPVSLRVSHHLRHFLMSEALGCAGSFHLENCSVGDDRLEAKRIKGFRRGEAAPWLGAINWTPWDEKQGTSLPETRVAVSSSVDSISYVRKRRLRFYFWESDKATGSIQREGDYESFSGPLFSHFFAPNPLFFVVVETSEWTSTKLTNWWSLHAHRCPERASRVRRGRIGTKIYRCGDSRPQFAATCSTTTGN